MKKMFLLLMAVVVAGCGYSTRSLVSDQYRTIFVAPFENKINYMAQDTRRVYVSGLEGKAREVIVDRYLFDGNLRLADEDTADLVLKGQLLGFEREELRLDQNATVKEYRIRVTVALTLWDPVTNKVVWEEPSFVGEATYYTSTPESAAMDAALKDLALRVVARTVEAW